MLDEDMPKSSAEVIREYGYEVTDVRDIGLGGATDEEIAEYAFSNNYVIVTRDLGFGNIFHYPLGSHHGVVILRLPFWFTTEKINRILSGFLKSVDEKKIKDSIIIVELGRYRRRKMS